jgi:CRP/FNR family transcriptional regulator
MLCVISPAVLSDVRRAAPADEHAARRLDDEIEREFASLRQKHVEAGQGKPVVRLAAFLVAVSRHNAIEGRDPNLVDETLNCAVIADYLGMRLDVLAWALMELESRGLVQPALDHGLRILDVSALDAVTCDGMAADAA